jgi:2,3-bisphosphoglycerate-independent phosphoglycerate mutase
MSAEPYTVKDGSLQDVAPTVLKLLGIDKPADMTGESLI